MVQPVQTPVDGQHADGTLLPDGSYAKNTDHYDPAFVARIKEAVAGPKEGPFTADEMMARIRSAAGHGNDGR